MSSVAPYIIARAARLVGRQAPWYNRFSTWRDLVLRQAMKPKKISPSGRTLKVMPRMFRRGYGLGGLVRRRKRRAYGRRVGGRKKTQNKVHSFIRWGDKDTLYGIKGPSSITEAGVQHLAYQFKLDNVTNPTDFTNLYDMYRINKIVLHMEPTLSANASNFAVNMPSRRVRVVHDYNDADPLTDEDQYLEYSNCKAYDPNRLIKVTLYPKINNVIENKDGAPTAYTSLNSNRVWLNIVDDEVSHFGLKVYIPPGLAGTEGTPLFNVRAKFYLSFKNSK